MPACYYKVPCVDKLEGGAVVHQSVLWLLSALISLLGWDGSRCSDVVWGFAPTSGAVLGWQREWGGGVFVSWQRAGFVQVQARTCVVPQVCRASSLPSLCCSSAAHSAAMGTDVLAGWGCTGISSPRRLHPK